MANSRTVRGFLAMVGVLAVVAAASTAHALTIHVNQNATWRYINATPATTMAVPVDWFTPGFVDTGWFSGSAPFTSSPTNAPSTFGADFANVNAPFAPGTAPAIPTTGTQWDPQVSPSPPGFAGDPYLRIHFNLLAPEALTVWIAVDNGINSMYLNGVLASGAVGAEGQAHRWESVFDVGAGFTVAGDNVLALQLEDHGGATAFMAMVTSDDAATNPGFIVPGPPTLAALGLGLAVVGLFMRRRSG